MSEQLQEQEQILDHAAALARVGGDIDLLKEIAALFIDEYPRELDEIHKGLATANPQLVEHSAHGLKGAVANFGARSAVEAAFQLEQLGRAGKLEQAAPALAALEKTLARLHSELTSIE